MEVSSTKNKVEKMKQDILEGINQLVDNYCQLGTITEVYSDCDELVEIKIYREVIC